MCGLSAASNTLIVRPSFPGIACQPLLDVAVAAVPGLALRFRPFLRPSHRHVRLQRHAAAQKGGTGTFAS
jgi:hypothetical protein